MFKAYKGPRLVPAILGFGSAIMVAFLVIAGFNAWRSYQAALLSTEHRTKNVADLVHHQLESTITTTAMVLDSMVDHVEQDIGAGRPADHGALHDPHLMYMASRLPNNPWLLRLDSNGVPVLAEQADGHHQHSAHDHIEDVHSLGDTRPASPGGMRPTMDPVAYLAYVTHHQAERTNTLWLGPPLGNGTSTMWSIGISRRISAPDGTFAGVALVLFAPDALMLSAKTMELGSGAGLGVVQEDGRPRIWLAEEARGWTLSNSGSLRRDIGDEGHSSDDVQAYISSRLALDSIPGLYATVSIPREIVRDIWLHERIADVVLVIGFGFVLLIMVIPASRLIVKPIRQIEAVVKRIGAGDFSQSASARPIGIREIRSVHDGIDAARASLAKLTGDLEDKRQQAETANRIKAEFMANMSHELRTPLNAILGFSEIILSDEHGTLSSQQQSEYLRDIHNSGAHLLEIINDILDLSKIEAGEYNICEDWLDVADTADAGLRLIKPRADAKAITLLMDLPSDLPRLRADERALKQILLNLLSNAVKFSHAAGQVRVSALWDGETGLQIQVTDTGIGMDPGQIEVALTPFRQVDNGLGRRHEGTGLGLPLVKSLVELHGGTLTIKSAVDRGTTITVLFPPNRGQRAAA